jgi:hypothetical protein
LLNEYNAEALEECGLHVHVGVNDFEAVELQNIARRYHAFESKIDTFVAEHRRGNNSDWCRPMKPVVDAFNKMVLKGPETVSDHRCGRYRKLNLEAYVKHGTVEFRQLEGTVDCEKILNWIQFCVAFVEASRLSTEEIVAYKKYVAELQEYCHPFARKVYSREIPPNIYSEYSIRSFLGFRDFAGAHILRKKIEEVNKIHPNMIELSHPGYWHVRMEVKVNYPEPSGTWDTGIPQKVVSYLNRVSKFNS